LHGVTSMLIVFIVN